MLTIGEKSKIIKEIEKYRYAYHVLNQSLRAQGTLLKLQAQALAQNNKHEKDYTAQYLKSSEVLSNAMKNSHPKFERPRF